MQSNSGHHPTPCLPIPKTITIINSQEQDLLGNQILPKLEDFCIWWQFYTLVTMAMAAILNFFNPLQKKKLPHTTGDIPTKFHEV